MIIRNGIRILLFAAAIVIVLPKIHAQDNITCNTDDFEANNCGGCDYGYNFDGSCQDGGPSGGAACPSSNPSVYLTVYNDIEDDGNGNLDIWSTTSNSDGDYGEGTLLASVSGSNPDGTSITSNSASTSQNVTVSAYTTVENYTQYADMPGNGQLTFSNQIQWACGQNSFAISYPTFRITYTYEQWDGTSTPLGASYKDCRYQPSCLIGTPTCAGTYYEVTPAEIPCHPWLRVFFGVAAYGNAAVCLIPGIAFPVGGSGNCT